MTVLGKALMQLGRQTHLQLLAMLQWAPSHCRRIASSEKIIMHLQAAAAS